MAKLRVQKKFQTWGDLLHHAADAPSVLDKKHRASRPEHGGDINAKGIVEYSDGGHWQGGVKTFEEVLDMGVGGWSECALDIDKISKPIFDKVSSLVEREDIVYDIEGHFIDIGRFVSEEPECWQRFESTIQSGQGRKIVKIVFNAAVSGAVGTDAIRKKGSLAVSLINLLEYAGFRTEVWVGDATFANGATYDHLETFVCIKSPDATLDLPRLAFALAHPATLRCLFFSVMETHDKEILDDLDIAKFEKGNYLWTGGYGHPAPLDDKGDIYIGENLSSTDFTEDGMKKWVMNQLAKQGVTLKT